MIRRFIEFVLPLLILAAALCLLWGALSRGPSTPRSEAQPFPRDHGTGVGLSADVVGPQSGAPNSPVDSSPPAVGSTPTTAAGAPPQRLDQAPSGGGGVSTAGLGNPLPGSANSKTAAEGFGLRPTAGAGGTPPPSAPVLCQSVCYVDVSEWDIPTPEPAFVVRSGLASTYGPRFSEWWVALPDGPGWRFRVCGPGGCRTLVSTDAGPSKAMQRAGRIVDLPVGAFSAVCGVPWTFGLCQVSLTILGRAR